MQFPYDEKNNQDVQYFYNAMQTLQDPNVTDAQISRLNQEIIYYFKTNSLPPNSSVNMMPQNNQMMNITCKIKWE